MPEQGYVKMAICPKCGLEMEKGEMEVHGGPMGITWIILNDSEIASRDLVDPPHLKERIAKHSVTGMKFSAERCRECDMILFKYRSD